MADSERRYTCGTHGFGGCVCPIETRQRLLTRGIVKEGAGASAIPWLNHITGEDGRLIPRDTLRLK